MEPKQPAPNLNPERTMPAPYESGLDQQVGIEVPRNTPEQREVAPSHEQAPPVPQGPVLPPPVSAPAPPPPTAGSTTTSTTPTDDMPLVANDDDLIEKEWVDKAKKIIAQTKDDPYKREQEIGRLQADYLKKRYGKQLGEVA